MREIDHNNCRQQITRLHSIQGVRRPIIKFLHLNSHNIAGVVSRHLKSQHCFDNNCRDNNNNDHITFAFGDSEALCLRLSADWNIGLAPQKEKEDFDERPNGPLTCDPGPYGARRINAEDYRAGRGGSS
jgi:hypothetical protein